MALQSMKFASHSSAGETARLVTASNGDKLQHLSPIAFEQGQSAWGQRALGKMGPALLRQASHGSASTALAHLMAVHACTDSPQHSNDLCPVSEASQLRAGGVQGASCRDPTKHSLPCRTLQLPGQL